MVVGIMRELNRLGFKPQFFRTAINAPYYMRLRLYARARLLTRSLADLSNWK